MIAVLAFIAGTAYLYNSDNTAFALDDTKASPGEGEIFVVLEEGEETNSLEETMGTLDEVPMESAEEVVESVAEDGAGVLLQIGEDADMDAALEALNQTEGIAYAQPNFRYKMMETEGAETTVNDALRDYQYSLGSWDPAFQRSCGVNVAKAWKMMGGLADRDEKGSAVIAVLDSGCQITHEDLAENVDAEHAYDAVTKKQGARYVADSSGHGTHVCGIAAGVADNEVGIAGASGNYATILPINVFVGLFADTADMVTAFSYLDNLMATGEVKNLHVINMSLGGYEGPDENDIALESCIKTMRDKDVLTVCAGGNGDDKTGFAYKDKYCYPGDFDDCLCVTSLDSDGTNSKFSDYSMEKDISAPGSMVVSTAIDGCHDSSLGAGGENAAYQYLSGTSMASPLVAGIAALLWADNPELTADQVFDAIIATAAPVNNAVFSHEGETGSAGAIDAAAAIEYAREHFDTKRENLAQGTITLSESKYEYDGNEKKPQVKVTCSGKTLEEGKEYLLSYRNCIEPGKASVTATGIDQYIGIITADYTISRADISKSDVVLEPSSFQYDGLYHFPEITVTMDRNELKWGKDFTPTALSDGTAAGTHKIRLDGKGNYTGSKTVSYTIIGKAKPAVPEVKVNTKFASGKFTYQVTKVKSTREVRLIKTTAGGKVTIPKSVKYQKKTYMVTAIGTSALKSKKKITAVTVPSSVRTIQAKAFAGCSGLKTVTLKTKKLTSKAVKGSLRGSSVKTIKVTVGTKKTNKQYVKKYRKIFTKKNCGKRVKIK